jgi:4-diphosphocytidyl-2-C-methyl-D-erythritol kinase
MDGYMRIAASGDSWIIEAPAKVNLCLEVLGKRTDGFHEIDTIMCPVSLLDELIFEPHAGTAIDLQVELPASTGGAGAVATARDAGTGQEASPGRRPSPAVDAHTSVAARPLVGEDQQPDPAWAIPIDASNLIVRALRAVQEQLGVRAGCRVRMKKCIPAAAGLGGGSSDAAAAIVAGLLMWSQWDRELAVRVGAALGSDIPLFFGDRSNGIGLARATGRGEMVENMADRPPLNFVITHPPVGSSTVEVYKRWRPLGVGANTPRPARCLRMREACATLDAGQIEAHLFNSLQPPASQLTDWIDRQLALLKTLGKPQALMSGSGSACFALAESPEEGTQLAAQLIELGLPRAFSVQAWYATPIEQQLRQLSQ